jgi:hypothetical protein
MKINVLKTVGEECIGYTHLSFFVFVASRRSEICIVKRSIFVITVGIKEN